MRPSSKPAAAPVKEHHEDWISGRRYIDMTAVGREARRGGLDPSRSLRVIAAPFSRGAAPDQSYTAFLTQLTERNSQNVEDPGDIRFRMKADETRRACGLP